MAQESYFVTVYDRKEDVNSEYMPFQCFWIDKENIDLFLKICEENEKYVQIDLDFTSEEENAEKNDRHRLVEQRGHN